ncbi:hypothetical protein [Actinoplanes awajinensis]|uniref:hypothetical protein n=1 Tax=Actinoplanes awajinensis TaxID=135946 RepID=UPI000AB12C59|nr:hypothetical protein [Actinoplanes awajinensis]
MASAAYGAFFRHGADTAGLHDVAWFLIAVAALLLVLILADRSLTRLSAESGRVR